MEVTNIFKRLGLINRVPEELWTEVCNIVQEVVTKTILQGVGKYKAKWLPKEALQIDEKRRDAKGKGKKAKYTHLNAEFQRIARRDRKAFLSDQCKEIEGNNRMRKTRFSNLVSSRELEIAREHFMQRWAQSRTEMVWT